jgi:hypothetical protein
LPWAPSQNILTDEGWNDTVTRLRRAITLVGLISLWATALSFVVPLGLTLGAELISPGNPLDTRSLTNGPCDFVIFWAVGRIVAAGGIVTIYDFTKTIAWQQHNMPAGTVLLPWQYPPPTLLLLPVVQRLPFLAGFLAWDSGLLLASALLLRCAKLPWIVILAAVLSPASLLSLGLGQFGLFSGCALVAAVAAALTRPTLAGAVFALLVIKPQTGVIAPIILLAQRNWIAMAAGLLGAAALCAASALVFGADVWVAFWHEGDVVSQAMLRQPFPSGPPPQPSSFEYYGISTLWMFRSLNFGFASSALAQATVAVAAMLVAYRAWRVDHAQPVARLALTLCLAALLTPYGYLYDLCGCSAAVAALAWQERRIVLVDVLLWVWPVLGLIISRHFYLELAPVVLAAAARRAWIAMRPKAQSRGP